MPQFVINLIDDISPPPVLLATGEPFGFTVYLSIVDHLLAGETSDVSSSAARLLADGVEIPVETATLSDTSAFGDVQLTGTLAVEDYELLSNAQNLDFDLGIRATPGGTVNWHREISGGHLAGKAKTSSIQNRQPSETVTFTIRDSVAERWTYAPVRPQIYYNPATTDQPVISDTSHLPVDETGIAIVPQIIADPHLTLKRALDIVYVEKLGFDSVDINIEDYNLESALEFTLEGGYDAAVRQHLSILKPITRIDNNKISFRVNGRGIPAGSNPHPVFARAVKSLARAQSPWQKTDRLKITYTSKTGELVSERTETDPAIEPIPYGDPGFTSTVNSRRIREWKRADNPGVIVKSQVVSTTTRKTDQTLNVLENEIQTDTYNNKGLKLGHTRTETKLLPTIETGVWESQTALAETEKNEYIPNPFNPSETVLLRSVKTQNGLVLVDPDNPRIKFDGTTEPSQTPIVEAISSSYIKVASTQTIENHQIRTFQTDLRIVSQGQLDWKEKVTNHCTGLVESTRSQTMPGSAAFDNLNNANQRTIYLGTTDANARKTAEFNGGELPFNLVLELGRTFLQELNDPPETFTVELAEKYDPLLRKGDFCTLYDRDGRIADAIIESRTITVHSGGFIDMSVSVKEVSGVVPGALQPTAPLVPFQFVVQEGTSLTFSAAILCYNNYQLSAAINSLCAVEAKLSSASDWVNLQTNGIDLSDPAIVNQTVAFDFRITAAAMSELIKLTTERISVEPIS